MPGKIYQTFLKNLNFRLKMYSHCIKVHLKIIEKVSNEFYLAQNKYGNNGKYSQK